MGVSHPELSLEVILSGDVIYTEVCIRFPVCGDIFLCRIFIVDGRSRRASVEARLRGSVQRTVAQIPWRSNLASIKRDFEALCNAPLHKFPGAALALLHKLDLPETPSGTPAHIGARLYERQGNAVINFPRTRAS